MPQRLHPVALLQGINDAGADTDTADILDLAARDRLPVGDQRQGFEQRARISRRLLFPQTDHPGFEVGPHLETEPRSDLLQLEAAVRVFFGQLLYRLADFVLARLLDIADEQLKQLIYRQRLVGSGEQGFED